MRVDSAFRPPLLLTVADAARRLALHEQTVRAMIRRGDLAAVRLGRFVRIFAEAVETHRRPPPVDRAPVRRAALARGARGPAPPSRV